MPLIRLLTPQFIEFMLCYLNGDLIQQEEASLGITDLAILRGYGIFDFFVFEEYEPRFLSDYLNRFTRSAERLRLDLPLDKAGIEQQIRTLIEKNGEAAGGIRLLLTGGYATDGYTPLEPNLLVLQYAFPRPPARHMEEGAHIMTHQYQREIPEVKTINYLRGIWLLPELRAQQADYALYHDGQHVSESDRSNVFLITADGELATPASNVLAGITRMKMLEVAASVGLRAVERELTLAEFETAEEVFITSTTKGAMPIISIDGRAVGNGQAGSYTRRLQAAFHELIASKK